jgi:hypothetical protein
MTNTTSNQTPKTETVTYRVGVPVVYRWATGTPRGYGVRYVEVEEAKTIIGAMRAVDAAIAEVGENRYHDEQSPTIEPNPGELGWPIGEF